MACYLNNPLVILDLVVSVKLSGLTDLPLLVNGTSLINLDLSNNRLTLIKSTGFVELSRLLYLDLSDNQIEYIEKDAFIALSNVIVVKLGHNILTDISSTPCVYFSGVTFLSLSHMRIDRIDRQSLAGLQSLRTLDLSHVNITSLDLAFLATLNNFSSLLLTGSHLSSTTVLASQRNNVLVDINNSFICCYEMVTCASSHDIRHLCSLDINIAMRIVYSCYGILIIILHISFAVHNHRNKLPFNRTGLVIRFSLLADSCQGVYILMVVSRDPLWDTGTVHVNGGPKHVWCTIAAWLQMASSSVSIALQTFQSFGMMYKAKSVLLVKNEKWQTIRNKILILCLIVSIINASPIFVSVSANNKLPDVSALCSFIHVSSFDGKIGLPVTIVLCITMHLVCIAVNLVCNQQVQQITEKSARNLAEFGVTIKKKRRIPKRICLRLAYNILVNLLCQSVFIFGFMYPHNIEWTLKGGWLMIVYSSQTVIHRILLRK